MGAIKLWITDIDGTILDETNVFSKRVLETIEKVKKSDTKMVVATGRMFNGAKGVADFLGLDTPVVCYQGAMVKLGDKILHQAPVKEELTRDVIKVLREKNIHTNLYNNDELIVEDDNKKIMSDYCQGRFTTYRAVDSFDNVELKNVYYSYEPEKPVLRDINLVIKKGEFIGIAGLSGAGKTTMADVIAGLLIPEAGQILVDGTELNNPLKIGYIPQEFNLINDTIKMNVVFGSPYIDEQKVIDSLKKAQLYDYIMDNYQEGIDSNPFVDSTGFSQGQKQRLVIARALYSIRPGFSLVAIVRNAFIDRTLCPSPNNSAFRLSRLSSVMSKSTRP